MNIDCVKCGVKPAVSGGLCESCIAESIHFRLREELHPTECRKCSSMQIGKMWHTNPDPSMFSPEVKSRLILNAPKLHLIDVETHTLDRERKVISGNLVLEDASGYVIRKEFQFPLGIQHQSCPRCNKVSGSSYEAIIQIRSLMNTVTDRIRQVAAEMEKYAKDAEGSKGGKYVLRTANVKGGTDIYLGSKNMAEKIIQTVSQSIPCSIQRTKKLFSRNDGQDLYRYTYLVRVMDIPRGNGVYVNEREYIMASTPQSKIRLFDIEGNRIVEFTDKDFFRRRVRVSQNYGTLCLLSVKSSDSSASVFLDEDGKEFTLNEGNLGNMGEKREVLKYRGKYYYLA